MFRFINQDFAKEVDDNNIRILIEEADKIDGIEPEVKDELEDLNKRWVKIHNATNNNTDCYDDLMTKWAAFREQRLALIKRISEKVTEVSGGKDPVNLVDEDDVAEHVKKLKVREKNTLFICTSKNCCLQSSSSECLHPFFEPSL